VPDVRVFSGRTSTGVRGIRLSERGDKVISMSTLRHVEATRTLKDVIAGFVAFREQVVTYQERR
jgi:hypothetical protein